MLTSLQGNLLIAAPQLEDANFFRSVVLLLQHDEQSAMGVILNRVSSSTVGEIWRQIAGGDCDSLEPIHFGGPVAGPLLAVHRVSSLSEAKILKGVFLATQKDHLDQLVAGKRPYRIFSGYAGWGSGQLEGELQMGGWLTLPATCELVFSPADDLWTRVSRQVGAHLVRRFFPAGVVPADPSLN